MSRIWRSSGAAIIDADEIAREVVRPGRPAYMLIRWKFGRGFFHNDGTLDRAALGRAVFQDRTKRRCLNRITHPFIVMEMLRKLVYAVLFRWHPLVILDTPLLFESKTLLPICSATVVVTCRPQQQLDRLLTRSRAGGDQSELAEEDAQKRIDAQMPLSEKCLRASYVLDNSGSVADLENNAKHLLQELQPSAAGEVCFRIVMIGLVSKVAFRTASRVLARTTGPTIDAYETITV